MSFPPEPVRTGTGGRRQSGSSTVGEEWAETKSLRLRFG